MQKEDPPQDTNLPVSKVPAVVLLAQRNMDQVLFPLLLKVVMLQKIIAKPQVLLNQRHMDQDPFPPLLKAAMPQIIPIILHQIVVHMEAVMVAVAIVPVEGEAIYQSLFRFSEATAIIQVTVF